jgi:hypothetical protein
MFALWEHSVDTCFMADALKWEKPVVNENNEPLHRNVVLITNKYLICALVAHDINPIRTQLSPPDFKPTCLFANKYETKRLIRAYGDGTLQVTAGAYAEALEDFEFWTRDYKYSIRHYIKEHLRKHRSM